MASVFSKFLTFINRIADVISQGSLERVRILSEFNSVFKDAYLEGSIDRLCKVTTSIGDPSFKHELSSIYFRSGFKITIENDENLKESDFHEISRYVIQSKHFVRQLMALGYDTLIIIGKNKVNGIQISLKAIANLQDYMID
ncbi:MAG: hypothetical protein RL207_2010 [Bacteroidota bacterium]|jgi:hypothetical protein